MAINKVKYGETTLIDLTGTTATSNTILQGYGAYGKDGVWIDGIAKQNTGMESVTQDQEGFVILDDDEGNQIAVNPLSVTENGTYRAATGNAYNPVTVNVPSPDFIVTLTKNSNDEWEPDCTFEEAKAAYVAGKNIMSYAGIEYITNIAYNEEYDAFMYIVNIVGSNVDSYQYKWSAEGVEPSFYTKYYQTAGSTATPSDVLSGKSFYNSTGRQTGTIATKSSSDLTVSGATVTAPAGYYSSAASKSVASMTLPTSASTTGSGTNKATIGRSTSTQYINIPTGYNSSARRYTISATPNGSATTPSTTITANPTISVNSSGLITATTSASQNITPTVSAGYVSSGTAGTVSVSGSKTQQLTTKGATTYTPSTTAQTIASGTYLTGTQTISGDSNLVAENIKKDVTIFGITGTAETEPDLVAKTVTPTKDTQIVTPNESTETLISGGETFKNISFQSGSYSFYNIATGIQRRTSSKQYRYIFTINQYSDSSYTTVIDSLDINRTISGASGREIATSKFFSKLATYDTGYSGYNLRAYGDGSYSTTSYFNIPSDSFKIYELSTTTHDGLSQVTVNPIPDNYIIPSGTTTITENNTTVDVTQYASATVNIDTSKKYYATITGSGSQGRCWAGYPDSYKHKYYTNGDSFVVEEGNTITLHCAGSRGGGRIYVDGALVVDNWSTGNTAEYDYVVPSKMNISIELDYSSNGTITLTASQSAISITENGTFDVADYDFATVNVESKGEYYEVYKAFANNALSDTTEGVSEWCNSFSTINTRQFEGRDFSGTFTFTNANTVGAGAFGRAFLYNVGTIGSFSLYVPNASTIGSSAFCKNFGITYISGQNVTQIYPYAFSDCRTLKTVDFPNCVSIGSSAFDTEFILPSVNFPSCTNIGTGAFNMCSKLSIASFPACTSIGNSAFWGCSQLSSVNIPNCVSIGSYAFLSCSALTSINLSNCTTVGNGAFTNCYKLSIVSFPICTSIGSGLFSNCSSLATVNFPNCTSIGSYAFYSCSQLESISFPNCTYVGGNAFQGCYKLSSVNISNCTNINNNAFSNCSMLTSINLPSCTIVGSSAFRSCWSLTTVILPACTNIGNAAFSGCYNLLSLYLLGSSYCSLQGTNAFYSTPISNYTTSTGGVYGSIFVPVSLYNAYITQWPWNTYSSRFVSLTEAEVSAILNS